VKVAKEKSSIPHWTMGTEEFLKPVEAKAYNSSLNIVTPTR
jgi:hypothetical protein